MKKGFTLAEILITLTIVGVVAALTLPALMTNVSQAKIGPALSKFVNTFENGTRHYMFENETSKLTAVVQDGENAKGESQPTFTMANVLDNLGKYIIWSVPSASEVNGYRIYNTKGEHTGIVNTPMTDTANLRILKDGGLVYFKNTGLVGHNGNYKNTNGTPYSKPIAEVVFDINGMAKPNVFSKDVFLFILDEKGLLIPYGSSLYNSLYGSSIKCNPGSESVYDLAACTGAVADNGWKANY